MEIYWISLTYKQLLGGNFDIIKLPNLYEEVFLILILDHVEQQVY